jgi:hypothetical protein
VILGHYHRTAVLCAWMALLQVSDACSIVYRGLYPSGTLDKRVCFLGGIGVGMVIAWRLRFPLVAILWLGVAGAFSLWFAFRR